MFNFSYFLGFVGLCNDLLLLVPLVVFHYTGIETFEWPERQTLLLMTINAFFGTFVSDF